MRIALAQINTTVGDFRGNLARISASLERGREVGADLVVFPEQTIPGYPAEDLLERRDFLEAAQETLLEAVECCHGLGMVLGTLEPAAGGDGNPVYNAAVLVENRRILGVQHKSLLPTYDVFDEARYFRPGERCAVFEFRGRRLGLAICEDFWNDPVFWPQRLYSIDPVARLVAAGADVLVGISASPFSLGRARLRYRMLRNTAIRSGVPLVYTNLVGGNTTLVFDGTSLALNARGELLDMAPGFEEAFRLVDLQGDRPAAVPAWLEAAAQAPPSDVDLEQTFRALVLGTRDYAAKTGFVRAVVGLSGGIDSALTAAIAVEALGRENVIGVAMPSRYSSPGSIADAEKLVQNLAMPFHSIPIEGIFSAALSSLAPVFGDLPQDVTEENIQARARGMLLMALSNKFGALLLTTGNKSELAVGYCTLYGDMSGGLAVISDLPKTLVYRLARWLNREREVIPVSSIEKPPSAELRPDQKDADSLPPYEVLDAILEAYIEERAGVRSIVERGFDRATVERVVRMVDASEYKRQQAAPGLRVTGKAFGPGRRVPIVHRFGR